MFWTDTINQSPNPRHKFASIHNGNDTSHVSLLLINKIKHFYRTRVRSLVCLSLTHSLTNCRLVNLIDVTLACEDDNSKLVQVVTVIEVDYEKRVDNSLVQIWKVKFGFKVKFLFRLWRQVFKVWSRFRSWYSGKFEAEVWSLFCYWCLVVAMRFILGRDSEARFGQDL